MVQSHLGGAPHCRPQKLITLAVGGFDFCSSKMTAARSTVKSRSAVSGRRGVVALQLFDARKNLVRPSGEHWTLMVPGREAAEQNVP